MTRQRPGATRDRKWFDSTRFDSNCGWVHRDMSHSGPTHSVDVGETRWSHLSPGKSAPRRHLVAEGHDGQRHVAGKDIDLGQTTPTPLGPDHGGVAYAQRWGREPSRGKACGCHRDTGQRDPAPHGQRGGGRDLWQPTHARRTRQHVDTSTLTSRSTRATTCSGRKIS